MNTELATDLLAQALLDRVDPRRAGVVIEVGLGGGNFSFTWAAPAGYRCFAVEPLPVPSLLAACAQHGVVLTEAALGTERGTAPIYLGELAGHPELEVSSLIPGWWGCGRTTREVAILGLRDFLGEHGIVRTSFLKVDTEGSELAILKQAAALPEVERPLAISFEYGGGGTRESGAGGWAPEFFERTCAGVECLVAAGYRAGFLLEASERAPRVVALGEGDFRTELFPGKARVGNLLLTRVPQDPEMMRGQVLAVQPRLNAAARRERVAAWRREWEHLRTRVIIGIRSRLRGRKRTGAGK